MKTFNIVLGKSVGNISIGIPRSEIRQLLGEHREFRENASSVNSYDQFAFCNIGYDMDDKVNFITIFNFTEIELILNDKIITEMTALELLAYISKLDKTVEIETGGAAFESNILGIAASFEMMSGVADDTGKKIIYDRLESISIAVPGYWKKS